jgi:hypothetical protein
MATINPLADMVARHHPFLGGDEQMIYARTLEYITDNDLWGFVKEFPVENFGNSHPDLDPIRENAKIGVLRYCDEAFDWVMTIMKDIAKNGLESWKTRRYNYWRDQQLVVNTMSDTDAIEFYLRRREHCWEVHSWYLEPEDPC